MGKNASTQHATQLHRFCSPSHHLGVQISPPSPSLASPPCPKFIASLRISNLPLDAMVVCKCRKATKLYCFVHKVPVCGECICFPEHQICVVRTYSDWVIDGEYEWPSTCSLCITALQDGSQTIRLGCLHLIHRSCLVSHIQSYPPQTAPAGYVCPSCSSSLWPPKSIKDTGSRLHSKLKEAIIQSGLEKKLFGNHLVTLLPAESRNPPPAFASDPLARLSAMDNDDSANSYDSISDTNLSLSTAAIEKRQSTETYPSLKATASSTISELDIIEIEGPSSLGNQFVQDHDPNFLKNASPAGPGATTRKAAYTVERQNSEIQYYADDEDGSQKKYHRRGPFHHKFLRLLFPFWSSALPTLPVRAPPRKDGATVDDVSEKRVRHQKSSRMDPRKILLTMAIMACMATMAILYYRLAQRSLSENIPEDEPQ